MPYVTTFPLFYSDEQPPVSELPSIHPTARINDCTLGSWTEIGERTRLRDCSLGDYSYIAKNTNAWNSKIGKFCSIADQVRINARNHRMERVTMHNITYRRAQYGFGTDDHEFFDWQQSKPCEIGHDVWLGHGVIILPSVKIGNGAVVGAGAVVTKNVECYTIVAGNPARPIRCRFKESVIEQLLRIAWWDWERTKLETRIQDLSNMDTFLEKYGR